jgi:uncharacterized flavoprotein (TIGR03862 family)
MASSATRPHIAIIGGGPAGLMAAEALSQANIQVDVFDAMPSLGRKFLLAGLGGLNITHSEEYPRFCSRYAQQQAVLQPMLDQFTPDMLRAWAQGLGVDTFVGTSGRVFPTEMKAAPLLRAWLHRLRGQGVRIHVRHAWQGWAADGALVFKTPNGPLQARPQATILALGGASWPKLGSNAAWVPWLQAKDIAITPFESANCGFDVNWSPYIRDKFAGSPLKSIALTFTPPNGPRIERMGELMISQHGVEGSLIYALSREIRQTIHAQGLATLYVDLLPQKTKEQVRQSLGNTRGGHALAQVLKKRLGISGLKLALLHEVYDKAALEQFDTLAGALKSVPITVQRPRPIEEAISSAGGVSFNNLDEQLMLHQCPGTFVAGEMLDWEAPTGGYLLTACLATGLAAGRAALAWLQTTPQ